jgi:hypothetical protein
MSENKPHRQMFFGTFKIIADFPYSCFNIRYCCFLAILLQRSSKHFKLILMKFFVYICARLSLASSFLYTNVHLQNCPASFSPIPPLYSYSLLIVIPTAAKALPTGSAITSKSSMQKCCALVPQSLRNRFELSLRSLPSRFAVAA